MRLGPPDPDHLTPEQKRIHDIIASGPRGRVRGPLAIWLHRPQLAEAAQSLGAYCRYRSSLDPKLSELAILCMACIWQAEFEWWAHKPIALKAGLAPDIVDALKAGTRPGFTSSEEAVVHDVVFALSKERTIPDPLYHEASAILGDDRLVDLVGLCGYYTLISMTLNAFEVPLPDGEAYELNRR